MPALPRIRDDSELDAMMAEASAVRDRQYGDRITYSPKIFLPLTQLCRDVCHYCTFSRSPKRVSSPYIDVDQALATARDAEARGCREMLFTLGEKPELRYKAAKAALTAYGYESTVAYLASVAGAVTRETGLLPHINAGNLSAEEIDALRPVSASMGLMLESASERLGARGMPHFGSPDKEPARRLETIRLAGERKVPFTSGILVGIGETRAERIDSLVALRDLHRRYGHIQEVIVQNFRAKPDTRMAGAPEPSAEDFLWTIAAARLIMDPEVSVQAPPNLSDAGMLGRLLAAGINDFGGVSTISQDYVNPEAPWPEIDQLERVAAAAGKRLLARLTVYPRYLREADTWLHADMRAAALRVADADGLARDDDWAAGSSRKPPGQLAAGVAVPSPLTAMAESVVERAVELDERQLTALFGARGGDVEAVCAIADALRAETVGDAVSYVVNRNINYTNICYFKCRFCAFSKGHAHDGGRERPYLLDAEEIARRVKEAWQRGATEICLQGGIHPDFTGQTYLDICRIVRAAAPQVHIHAFSPLEVWQGARTLNMPTRDFLERLAEAGLGSLPGTAAEVLDDEVRAVLCPDKINTAQWLSVMEDAHSVNLRSTSTIMFGHIERPVHWARHLLRLRELQCRTGGLTEFVPLPFVHMEAPMYHRGEARRGPTFRETLLMHAVGRLALHPHIRNIQASWVKMGPQGAAACLSAGANDLGGSLMNESITRAAGASHGQEMPPERIEALIRGVGRTPRLRDTRYGDAPQERASAALAAPALLAFKQVAPRRRRAGAAP